MKKLLILLCVVAMMLPLFCACTGNDGATDGTTAAEGDVTTTVGGDVTTGPIEEDIYASVPEGTYDHTLTIYNQTSSWAFTLLDAEMNGDTIDDAVAERNMALEKKLGIQIEVTDIDSGLQSKFEASYSSGDNPDLVWTNAGTSMTLALNGYAKNANDIATMNTDNEWWYPESTDSVNYLGTKYLLFSDIHLHFHESYYVVAFNQDILGEYPSLTNPYDHVKNNTWTFDAMYDMMTVAAKDDGDGVPEADSDVFGLCAHTNQGHSMLIALGNDIIVSDNKGSLSYVGTTDRLVDSYEIILKTLYDKSLCFTGSYHPVFSAGRSLFMTEVTGSLKQHRNDAFAYGIVVVPKYNSKQENYISPLATSVETLTISSNRTEEEFDMLGVILENMAAESHRTLKPAYYEIMLHLKYAKDEKSIDMLRTVYAHGRIEKAYVFNLGSIRSNIESAFKSGNKNIANILASHLVPVSLALDEHIAKVQQLEEGKK